MKRVISYYFALILCAVILTACSTPGPVQYTFGGIWESDGNAISFLSAVASDSYTASDGVVHTPAEGKLFIVIECNADLAEGWRISDDTYLNRRNGTTQPHYKLFCEPIPVNSNQSDGNYVLLFSVSEDSFTGSCTDYQVKMVIEKSKNVRREQVFLLS